MSAENLAALQSALSTTFSDTLARQMNRDAALARFLRTVPNTGQGGGKQVAWDVEFSGASAAAFAEGSDVAPSEFNYDPLVPAVLPYGQYRSPFQVSNLEMNAAAASPMQAKEIGKIVLERVFGGLTKIASVMNADLFTGTGTDGNGNPNIIGLSSALISSGSYAGISTALYPEWKSNLVNNGGVARSLTMDLLSQAEAALFQASGGSTEYIVTSAGVLRKYEGLFNMVQRVDQGGRSPTAPISGGFPPGTMYWRGIPIIRDRNCPVGTMYLMNGRQAELRVLPWAATGVDDGVPTTTQQATSSNGDTAITPTSIPCMVYPLGRTGSGVKWVVETYIQLKVLRPNGLAILADISEV